MSLHIYRFIKIYMNIYFFVARSWGQYLCSTIYLLKKEQKANKTFDAVNLKCRAQTVEQQLTQLLIYVGKTLSLFFPQPRCSSG